MLSLVERVLGLTSRELRRAFPLFAYLFLTMASSVASKAARDALFLDRYRAIDLPYVDIAIAVLVGVAASVYLWIGHRTNLRNLLVGSILFFAANAILFWTWAASSETESGALFIAIYIWVGVFSVLAPSQVWTLANYVMTTREAKRSFGFIGSGAILGWIVGGLATREGVSRFGTENMLAFIALSLFGCAGLVILIWRDRPDYVGNDMPAAGTETDSRTLWGSLALVRESPYLRAIAALILISALATTVAGWQFKAIAKAAIPGTDELAMFFGTFNMIAGVMSLLLQLLLTGRVLRTAGVGAALFIVPTAMLMGSLGVFLLGTLVAAAALKASDQVLRYSIDKATTELLYLPVPAAHTFRVKSFIDTVVYRLGDAGGGLIILLFAAALQWSAVDMSRVGVVLLGAWLVAAWIARRQYVENLRESIHQHRVDYERASMPVMERDATALISSRLKGTTREIAYALSLFEMAHDRKVHPAVRGLLRHEQPEIRRQAIALLARAGDTSVKAEVEELLRDPSLEVRTEALMYLTTFDQTDPLERIESLGDFEDFSIRAAVVAFLARPGATQNVEASRLMLARMAEEQGDQALRTRLEAARLIGTLPDLFERELRTLLDDEDVAVARAAIAAAGKLKKRTLTATLIERLADPSLAQAAIDALAEFGDRIVGTLRDYLTDEELNTDVRREIPKVLQAIGSQAAQAVLIESVLDRDVILRYHVIAALNKLGQQHPERSTDRKLIESVLAAEIMGHYRSYQVLGTLGASLEDDANPIAHGLRESIEKEAERIFRLLKILYPQYDMHSAHVGLQSNDPIVHDNAVEFLDSVLPPEVRAVLIPLFDREVPVAVRIESANRMLGAALGDREEAIEVMALSQDPWLRSCAAYAMGEMRLTRFAATLDEWAKDSEPLLRATAIDAREKLRHAAASAAGVDAL
ncbi:MAG: Npt1/Npt2 family nucleotide transporter [Acidobacteriota bacterium]|nr:Npt1/Npt2 family nucleotide transporter [Acidobacteriota bacterium]MDP3719263.1 Npt1/Npt2 family nucleotide transporter [Acidobacteriota bacterium]